MIIGLMTYLLMKQKWIVFALMVVASIRFVMDFECQKNVKEDKVWEKKSDDCRTCHNV